jgi:hypothetical protein
MIRLEDLEHTLSTIRNVVARDFQPELPTSHRKGEASAIVMILDRTPEPISRVAYYCIWAYLKRGLMNGTLRNIYFSGKRDDTIAASVAITIIPAGRSVLGQSAADRRGRRPERAFAARVGKLTGVESDPGTGVLGQGSF